MIGGIGGAILFDFAVSFAISFAVFAILKYAKKFENKRALKISAVVFAASATVIGIIIIWLVSQMRDFVGGNIKPMYGVESIMQMNSTCIQQCEQIADKAGEILQDCINACRIR